MEDLAKPSGVTLDAHNQHLFEQAKQIMAVRPVAIKKYRAITAQDLVDLVHLSITWHDEGKRHSKWQKPCRLDYQEFKRLQDSDPEARHEPEGRHLRAAHIRHEIASLLLADQRKQNLPWLVKAAIAAHHGKLSKRHENRWRDDIPELATYWDEFMKLSYHFPASATRLKKLVDWRYRFAGPRALLQLADHRASASEAARNVAPFHQFSYSFPFRNADGSEQRRGVQKIVDELKDEWFAILRAPTGSGKTDAALLWAKYQISIGRADRLVIAMPTRFTANALSIGVADNLSKTGVYHSSTFLQQDRDQQEMARLLETPITVTTIDHLCISLTGTREDQHAIFFNLASACVVIDEVDFYDEFTQHNILVLLRVLWQLKAPVLLMSATVPESAARLYEQSGFAVSQIYEDDTPEGVANSTRPRCNLKREGFSETPDDIAHLLRRAVDGEPLIIYANTVKRAQTYYDWFENHGCASRSILYHSRFTEPHKAEKEKDLLGMLGPEAWKSDQKPQGIAILTQIGEMSVNISAEIMISDVCPADRLAQRVGRLCRFPDAYGKYMVGELYVVDPSRSGKDGLLTFYPAPYGEWHRNTGWIARESLTKTRELLTEKLYSAQDFVNLVNTIYPLAQQPSSRTKGNTRMLEAHMQDNWLILPAAKANEDDDQTEHWRSRDISPQMTLYVGTEFDTMGIGQSQSFKNWQEYRRFELQHGVQCSLGDAQRAEKNGWADVFHLRIATYSKDEDTSFPVLSVRLNYYDKYRGLWFDREDNE